MQNGRIIILNVDDNETARYARRRILTAAGFRVADAATGEEAVRLAAKLRPALVLLGVRLPDIDGFEVCRRLKRAAKGGKPVVVHISAVAADEHSQVRGLDNGADAYLTEPVDAEVLVAIVRSALRGHDEQSALAEERDAIAGTSNRLTAVLESTTDSVMYIEPDWSISYLNTRARNSISGGRDLIGWNLWDAFPEAVGTAFFTEYRAAMRDRRPAHFDAWYEPLGAWFEIHAHPAEDGGLAIFFRDITEKKRIHAERQRVQEELQRREIEYKTLAENAPEVIARFDRELRHTYINRYGTSVYGIPREQIIGRTNTELGMPPEKVAYWKARFEDVFATGMQQTVEFEFDSPTFGHQYFSSLFVPEFGAGGEVVSILAITRDVTELRRADEELRRANTVMEAISTGAPLLIAVKDTDSRYLTANAAALEMLGLPAGDVQGRSDAELLGPETGAAITAMDQRVMSTGRTETLEVHITRPHREYWLLSTKTPLRDHEGNITGVVVVANDITERKRAEEALRESEERFRAMADNIAQFAWMADNEGSIFWYNRRWYDYTGTTLDEMRGRGWWKVHHPDHVGRVADKFRHSIETGEIWEDTFPLRGKNGNYRWFLSRARPIRDAQGRVVRWFGTNTDITAQLDAEERLRESERHLKAILENMSEGLIVVSPDGLRLHWNRAALAMHECEGQAEPLEDLPKLAEFYELATPEGRVVPFDQWPLQRVLRDEHLSDCEMLIRHKRLDWERIFSYGGSLIRDERGEPWMGVLTIRDVTGRKRAEEALIESERRFRELADSMPQLVWITQPDGKHVYFNRRWYEQVGASPEESLGEGWAGLLHPEDRERCLSYWRRCLETGEPYQIEYRSRVAGGEYRWFLGRAVPARDDHGRITRWFGTCTDIEDGKRAEAALRQTQKLESVGLLAGGIAHDFNNLLVGVIGNASLAADILPPRHPAAGILERVVESGEQAAHLTRQLLAYAGKGSFVIEPVNLSSLVEEARALIESSVSKKIVFRFDLEPEIPAVETDASQMQQVLMNLALNAAEAIDGRPGTISIATGEMIVDEECIANRLSGDWTIKPGRFVVLEVADTGCGMDKATLEKVFEPFFTTKFQGRGLGLAAVAGIVRSHKGAIQVTTAPGAGATFRVLLPAAGAVADTPSPVQPRAEDLHGAGTVMVVDDEAVVRNLARQALEGQGYKVLLAESGSAAIELLRDGGRGVGLVILDLSMPGLSGEETLRRLREDRPDLNVLVSSGYSEAEALRLFHGIPISGFIQKPYTVAQLARAVKAALAG